MAQPTLAFAHANGFPGGSYRCFLEAFSSRFEVHYPDRLGHDPKFPVGVHWRGLADELESFLRPLPKPVTGVGHSLGGVLMFMVASRRPDWFRSLVMLDPPLINGMPGVAFNILRSLGFVDRISPAGKSRGRLDHWRDRGELESYFRSRALFSRFDARCLADYLDAGIEPDGEGLRLHFRPEVEVEIFRTTPGDLWRYPRLQVPGAVINARDSGKRFLDGGKRHARRHNMHHEVVAGGHLFPLERPEAAAQQVLATIHGLEGQA
jgi:pimeloyl-ACP methyl ester carboxylesterase